MSLLNFPSEVSLQLIQKMKLVDRINLSITHTRLSPLCFDRSLQRKSTEALTLNELRQLYEQSRTENEKDQCFKSNVLNRVVIKNFNEVVRMYMDPNNKLFLANGKVMHSLKGQFILVREKEDFSASFVEQFLCLVRKSRRKFTFNVCRRYTIWNKEKNKQNALCTNIIKQVEKWSESVLH